MGSVQALSLFVDITGLALLLVAPRLRHGGACYGRNVRHGECPLIFFRCAPEGDKIFLATQTRLEEITRRGQTLSVVKVPYVGWRACPGQSKTTFFRHFGAGVRERSGSFSSGAGPASLAAVAASCHSAKGGHTEREKNCMEYQRSGIPSAGQAKQAPLPRFL